MDTPVKRGAYSAADLAYIRQHRAGPTPTPWDDIAKALNRASRSCIQAAYYYQLRPKDTVAPTGHKVRPCMTCSKPFMSEGAHNRMCRACRAGADAADAGYTLAGVRLHA